jgi:cell division protein FtsW
MITKLKTWADNNLQGDRVIWAVVFGLSIISILVVYSSIGTLAYKRTTTPEVYLVKHTFMVALGLAAMWFAHKIDYRYYSRISRFALWISVPLLIYTFTNGTTINDAARWITLPIINTSFQPSDFASLALIINLASMLSKRQQNIEDFKEALIPVLIWCGVILRPDSVNEFVNGHTAFCHLYARYVHWPCARKVPGYACADRVAGRRCRDEIRCAWRNGPQPHLEFRQR